MLVPIIGTTVNGATRWLGSDAFRFQPSEFLKPVFVVTLAWMLSLRSKDRTLPVIPLSAGLTAFVGFLLMHQPDLGQTVIFCSAWLSLMLLAGMSARWIGVLVGTGITGLVAAYLLDRKGVGEGKSGSVRVDIGGGRNNKKNKNKE